MKVQNIGLETTDLCAIARTPRLFYVSRWSMSLTDVVGIPILYDLDLVRRN